MPSRTTITTREFRCRDQACPGAIRSKRIRLTYSRDFATGATRVIYHDAEPVCDTCGSGMRVYNPRGSGVREGERTIAWVSPDGTQAANLAEPHGMGPQGRMYRAAGWERIECDTLQKLERVNAIRTAQKSAEAGHEVISRFEVADYDAATIKADNDTLAAIEAGDTESDFISERGVPDIIPTS